QRLVNWVTLADSSVVHAAIFQALGNMPAIITGSFQPVSPEYLRWAARFLAQDTGVQSAAVQHAVSLGMRNLPRHFVAADLAVAYVRGFPVDLTHTSDSMDGKGCTTCKAVGGTL
ncbi:hypothetical protein BC828DRAFT_407676, partial [Blastocladiella britannica]